MRGQTHSQNSMTGEVAFGLVEWLSDVFAFRNSTQFSEGLKKTKKKRQASQTQRWKRWAFWAQLSPVFHVLLQDDQAKSQEKEKER